MGSLWNGLTDLLTPPFDEVKLHISEAFSSQLPDSRLKLRMQIERTLLGAEALDLHQLPRHNLYTISVAHNPQLGLFAWAPNQYELGIDIEICERVNMATVNRVSNLDEVQAAPSPAHLWVAKEAAFKAHSKMNGTKLTSDIVVCDWRDLNEVAGSRQSSAGLEVFEKKLFSAYQKLDTEKLLTKGMGLTISNSSQILGIFLLKK